MKLHLAPDQHHKTKNARGFMHPITQIGREFIDFAKNHSPTIDMGCAYGNTVIAAIKAGAEKIIACDMEKTHLNLLAEQLDEKALQHVSIQQGILPHGFNFASNSIAGIHASLVLPYLTEAELDTSLGHFYNWLQPGGKFFFLSYSIYIKELINPAFEAEYHKRCREGRKWPSYLEDFNRYSYTDGLPNPHDASTFPIALHVFERDTMVNALKDLGFIIDFAEYLDGPSNGAVEDTWHDGREFIGIIAHKP